MHNKTIIKRFAAMEEERKGSVEQVWDLIERFVLPFRGDFYATLNSEQEVDWHRRDVWDSTAVFACQSLAASLQGNLTSPSTRWFDLRFRDEKLNKNDTAMEWLEECAKLIFEALQESNFNIEIAEAYIDIVGFGTTTITQETEDDFVWDGLNFQAMPVREMFFEEDHKKGVHILYRRLQMTPVQMLSKWGEEGVPEKIKVAAKDAKAGTQKEKVIFCIYPRRGKGKVDTSKPLVATERPFGFKYVLKTGAKTLGKEGGYYEMPAYVGRWRKTAGSKWGHSAAVVAMGDILTLNQLKEAIFESAGKAIDPVLLGNEDAAIGNIDLDRGQLNIVGDIDGIRELTHTANFSIGELQVEHLQEAIRKAFYQDQLELKESPAMTATEVNVRYEMIQRLLGPTSGRLQNDIFSPTIQRSFNIMFRAGQLPEVPEGLKITDMDIEYTGPLPRAQKMETAQAIDRWMMSMVEKAETFPEALDMVDVDAAELEKARLLGVPAIAIRGEADIKKIRDDRAAAQESAQKAALAQGAGDAAKAVGEGAAATGAQPAEILKMAGVE